VFPIFTIAFVLAKGLPMINPPSIGHGHTVDIYVRLNLFLIIHINIIACVAWAQDCFTFFLVFLHKLHKIINTFQVCTRQPSGLSNPTSTHCMQVIMDHHIVYHTDNITMFSFRELARSTKQIKLADRSFPNQIKTKLTIDVPGTNGRAPPDYAVTQRRVVALMVTSCLLDGEQDRSNDDHDRLQLPLFLAVRGC
jgi:hypothetical protein